MSVRQALEHWLGRSLRRRLVALFLGLLLLVQLLGLAATRQSVQANARQSLEAELNRADQVLKRQMAQNTRVLGEGVRLLARDFGFMQAVLTRDQATVAEALSNQAARIQASTALLLDPQGRLLAQAGGHAPHPGPGQAPAAPTTPTTPGADQGDRTDPTSTTTPDALNQVLQALPTGEEPSSAFALLQGRPVQLVRTALKPPQAPEQVVMAFPLDRALLNELESISGVQMALVAQPPGQVARVVASSDRATPAPVLARLSQARQEVELDAEPAPGERVVAHTTRLAEGPSGQLRLVFYKSIDDAVRPYQRLQALLAAITAGGVLLFGLGSVATARHLTRPVAELVAASRRLGEGQFDVAPPAQTLARPDELGVLARAFDTARQDLSLAQAHIHELAFRDRLTHLPNRVQLEEALQAALAQGADHPPAPGPTEHRAVGLITLNLDRLERVNQLLGRPVGDRVLIEAAERLSREVLPHWPGALVARLGGDEFALLLPRCAEPDLQRAAGQIHQVFEPPLQWGDSVVDLSAAMGMSWAGQMMPTAEQLLSQALLALSEAKRRREPVVQYAASLDQVSTKTLSLLGELRRALREQELRLWLQPKVNLQTGKVSGAECLVRWQHPERGLVPPVQFIPFAEETGFIHELSLWVMDAAARAAGQWGPQGLPRLSINLSAHDLMKPQLLDRLRSSLQNHGARTGQFCLEITESAIALDPRRALQTLHELHTEGFKLSIDDFGAGYTSLAQLIELPVDELKLDMIFVRTMDQDADKAAMVRSLINMAHDRQLRVVAEGVENAQIMAQLQQWHCDEGQGWHLGRPMPCEDFMAWMATHPQPGT